MFWLKCNPMRLFALLAVLLLPGVASAQLGGGGAIAVPVAPTVQFGDNTSGNYLAYWTSGTFPVTITVALPPGPPPLLPITVQWVAADGSAKSPTDYSVADANGVTQSGTAIFPPGTTTQTLTVTINNNGQTTPKSFTISLSNPQGATLASPNVATITIDLPPPPPTVQFSSAKYWVKEVAGESSTVKTITVTLSGPSATPVTVDYATSDGTGHHGAHQPNNYARANGTLTFTPMPADPTNPAVTTQTFNVTINNNGKPGPNRWLNLTLSSPSNNSSPGTPMAAELTIENGGPKYEPTGVTIRATTSQFGSTWIQTETPKIGMQATLYPGPPARMPKGAEWKWETKDCMQYRKDATMPWVKATNAEYRKTLLPPTDTAQDSVLYVQFNFLKTGEFRYNPGVSVATRGPFFKGSTTFEKSNANTEYRFHVVDKYKVKSAEMEKVVYTAKNAKEYKWVSDDVSGSLFKVHWVRTKSMDGVPVSWTRKGKIRATATVKMDPAPPVGLKIQARMKGPNAKSDWTDLSSTDAKLVTFVLDSVEFLKDEVDVNDNFTVDFEIRIPDLGVEIPAKTPFDDGVVNRAYFTWAQAKEGLCETCFFLGCTYAKEATGKVGTDDLGQVYDPVFNSFIVDACNFYVKRRDGDPMRYYGRMRFGGKFKLSPVKVYSANGVVCADSNSYALNKFNSAEDLVYYLTGTSKAWCDLYIKTFAAQGLVGFDGNPKIKLLKYTPRPLTIPPFLPNLKTHKLAGFAMKNWSLSPDPHGFVRSWWEIINADAGLDGDDAIPLAKLKKGQAADAPGVLGQGQDFSLNPPAIVAEHYVVDIGTDALLRSRIVDVGVPLVEKNANGDIIPLIIDNRRDWYVNQVAGHVYDATVAKAKRQLWSPVVDLEYFSFMEDPVIATSVPIKLAP